MKTLQQRQQKLKLLEEKLNHEMQEYQIQLEMVEAEYGACKQRLSQSIIDDKSISQIEYVIEFKPYDSIADYVGDNIKKTLREPVKVEGTFEIIREDEAEIISLWRDGPKSGMN